MAKKKRGSRLRGFSGKLESLKKRMEPRSRRGRKSVSKAVKKRLPKRKRSRKKRRRKKRK